MAVTGRMVAMVEAKISGLAFAFLTVFFYLTNVQSKWLCSTDKIVLKENQTLEGPCGFVNLKFAFGNNMIKGDFHHTYFKPDRINDFYIAESNFNGAQLEFMTFKKGKVSNTQFTFAKMKGAKFQNVSFNHVDFTNANLAGTQFINCKFESVVFTHADLRGTLFQFNYFINSQLPSPNGYFSSGNIFK